MRTLNNARKGAALTEYGIVVGLVSVLAIGAVLGTGTEVKTVFCIATNGVREGMAKASNTEFVPIGICSFDVADSDLSGSPEAPGASDGTDSGAGTQPIAPTGEIGISTASTLFTEAGMVNLLIEGMTGTARLEVLKRNEEDLIVIDQDILVNSEAFTYSLDLDALTAAAGADYDRYGLYQVTVTSGGAADRVHFQNVDAMMAVRPMLPENFDQAGFSFPQHMYNRATSTSGRIFYADNRWSPDGEETGSIAVFNTSDMSYLGAIDDTVVTGVGTPDFSSVDRIEAVDAGLLVAEGGTKAYIMDPLTYEVTQTFAFPSHNNTYLLDARGDSMLLMTNGSDGTSRTADDELIVKNISDGQEHKYTGYRAGRTVVVGETKLAATEFKTSSALALNIKIRALDDGALLADIVPAEEKDYRNSIPVMNDNYLAIRDSAVANDVYFDFYSTSTGNLVQRILMPDAPSYVGDSLKVYDIHDGEFWIRDFADPENYGFNVYNIETGSMSRFVPMEKRDIEAHDEYEYLITDWIETDDGNLAVGSVIDGSFNMDVGNLRGASSLRKLIK